MSKEMIHKENMQLLQKHKASPLEFDSKTVESADLIHAVHELEVKKLQRENLNKLKIEHSDTELFYKHYETITGYIYNLNKFRDAVQTEIEQERVSLESLVAASEIKKMQ